MKSWPIAVISSLSSMGKTRIAEEGIKLFDEQLDVESRSILVTYGNCRTTLTLEEHMSMQASFAWRLLHAVFVNRIQQSVGFDDWIMSLPSNAADLTLKAALQAF
jgi:hypothetical protein